MIYRNKKLLIFAGKSGYHEEIFSFLLFYVFAGSYLFAQTEDLLVRSGDKGLFLEHKLTPKENFYSIGRLFNVPPKYCFLQLIGYVKRIEYWPGYTYPSH